MSKRIKQVDGVKVLYRYSLSIIFTGLFCLGISAGSVIFVFLPYLTFTPGNGDVVNPVNLKNLFYSIMLWNNGFLSQNPIYNYINSNVSGGDFGGQVAKWLFFALAIFVYLAALFDAILSLTGLWLVFIGKSHHLKAPKVLAGWSFTMHLFATLVVAVFIAANSLLGLFAPVTGTFFSPSPTALIYLILYVAIPLVGLIALSIIYSGNFRYYIYYSELGELRRNSANNLIQEPYLVDHKTETRVKVQYKYNKGLPPKVSHIGGHEFAANTNLEIAMIPEGIKELGIGAFANCLNLKVVSIPKSVKVISPNTFWNCRSLKRINYAGTKEEFALIKRGSNWLAKAGTSTVICSNGGIIVDQYK